MKGRKSMGYIRVREQVAFETQEQADAFKEFTPKERGDLVLLGLFALSNTDNSKLLQLVKSARRVK